MQIYTTYIQTKQKMAPPNTDVIIQEIEKLNLQTLARTKGNYVVYPDDKVQFY